MNIIALTGNVIGDVCESDGERSFRVLITDNARDEDFVIRVYCLTDYILSDVSDGARVSVEGRLVSARDGISIRASRIHALIGRSS